MAVTGDKAAVRGDCTSGGFGDAATSKTVIFVIIRWLTDIIEKSFDTNLSETQFEFGTFLIAL